MPAPFNDHRGVHYHEGDVIDVRAHQRRVGRLRYIVADLGSVRIPDDVLSLRWEHLARYVVH